jgi:hypothetical protein
MIYPIANVVVHFPNGDSFHTQNIEHLYNLHLELEEAYPMLPRGGFRLHLLEENEEEEQVRFELLLDDTHLQMNVLLEDMGDLAVFSITFSWWLHGGKEEWEEPCDSWTIHVAIDLNGLQRTPNGWVPASYGLYDAEENAVIQWHDRLEALLQTKNTYGAECIQRVQKEFHECLNEIVLSE